MSKGQLFYWISPFLPGCESSVVKSAVIFEILILKSSENKLTIKEQNKFKTELLCDLGAYVYDMTRS